MEIILEHAEVVNLLKEALLARGIRVPVGAVVRVRRNNKLNTIRVVFVHKKGEDP